MPVRYKQVKVTRWCANPAECRGCVERSITDQAVIDKAVEKCHAKAEWTSPPLAKGVAGILKACVEKCGGTAEVIDA